MKHTGLIAHPDQKFVEALEMIIHFVSSESENFLKNWFLFNFSSIERSVYTHDKCEVQHFHPLDVFSEKIEKTDAHFE